MLASDPERQVWESASPEAGSSSVAKVLFREVPESSATEKNGSFVGPCPSLRAAQPVLNEPELRQSRIAASWRVEGPQVIIDSLDVATRAGNVSKDIAGDAGF